jgi:hypothetical protein
MTIRMARTQYLGVVLLLMVSSGASCPRSRQIVNDYAPVVLTPEATLEDVIRVVNANSARIRQVQSSGATLTVDGMPPLEASYALERPHLFRLRAETRLTGPELDVGSNDSVYWIWIKRSDQPAIYWGRHEEFYQSAARNVLPMPPEWLIEALGVVELDPTGQHEGPFRQRPGQLEVRTSTPTPGGPLTKVTVVDDARGWVLEQHLFDAAQQPLASAFAAGFQFDQVNGVSLPRVVDIRLPPTRMNLRLETQQHRVNQLVGDPAQLWTMPQINGAPLVNLNSPGPLGYQSGNTLLASRPPPYTARSVPPPRDPAIRRLPPFDRLR